MRCCKLPKYVEQELPRDILPKDTAKKDARTGVVVNSGPFQSRYTGLLVGSGGAIEGSKLITVNENTGKVNVEGDFYSKSAEVNTLKASVATILSKLVIPLNDNPQLSGEISVSQTGHLKWKYGNNVWTAIRGGIAQGQVAFGSSADTVTGDNALYWDDANKQLGVGTNNPTHKLHVQGNVHVSGELGVGIENPSERLEVAGNIGIRSGASSFVGTLDNNHLSLRTNNADRLFISNSGDIGVNTDSPTAKLDVNGETGYNQLRLRTPYTPTSSSDPNGNIGDIAWDDNYIYVKTSTGWKRALLSEF